MNNLYTFIERLRKLNINIILVSNYPWVYIESINGKIIKETYQSIIGYFPIKPNQPFRFTNIKELFKLIRRYLTMKEYEVEIVETLKTTVKVLAENKDDAIEKVRLDYIAEKIVLDASDFDSVDISNVKELP